MRSSLKSQESDPVVGICYPEARLYRSLPALETNLQHFTADGKQQSTKSGILIGKLIPIPLSDALQMDSIHQHIIALRGTNDGSISEVAEECRSIFFTNPAGGGGMLYRLGEHVVYLLPPGGQENVLTLTKLLRVKSINDYYLFATGECLELVMQHNDAGSHTWGKGALLRPAGSEVTVPSSCYGRLCFTQGLIISLIPAFMSVLITRDHTFQLLV